MPLKRVNRSNRSHLHSPTACILPMHACVCFGVHHMCIIAVLGSVATHNP